MDIGNALRRAGRDDITIRSIIANTVKEVYRTKTSLELSIDSVQIKGKKIFIKTGQSILNSELQFLEGDIKKASLKKLNSMHIKIGSDTVFRFI